MGISFSRALHAFGGMDIDDQASTESEVDLDVEKGVTQQKQSKAPPLHKSRSPLKFLQFEKTLRTFQEVCPEVDASRVFNIERDVKLKCPIRIVLLGTGVFCEHRALVGRIGKIKNFVPRGCQQDASKDAAKDSNGHGTFCAGLIVGGTFTAGFQDDTRESTFQNGVAPFAEISVGKVLDKDGHGKVEWLIRGLRWACDLDCLDSKRAINADIICIPTGLPQYHPDLRKIIYLAIQQGKLVVCSAGSDVELASYDIQYPARFGDVICVGGQSENGQPTALTPAGREVDVLAPADKLYSASSKGVDMVKCNSSTTFAAAIVAGICAIILAYAEIVGGPDLRKLMSHTVVMKELLRAMSSNPQHHDRLAGYGNVLPHRLLRQGPQALINRVLGMVHQQQTDSDAKLSMTLGPLQPVLSNFSTLQIMGAIPLDKAALDMLLVQPIKERVVFKWYELLENLFMGDTSQKLDEIMPVNQIPETLHEVDFSLPNSEFTRATRGTSTTSTGINLTHILQTYFKSTVSVEKLTLPEFPHILHLDSELLFGKIVPQKVMLSGNVPLLYLLDIVCGVQSSRLKVVAIHCDNLTFFMNDGSDQQAEIIKTKLANIKAVCVGGSSLKIRVFISRIHELTRAEKLYSSCIEELKNMSSQTLKSVLVASDWIDEESVKTTDTEENKLFFSQEDDPNVRPEDLPESSQEIEIAAKEKFSIWPYIKDVLCNKRKVIALEEFAHRAKPLADALLRGYNCALKILNCAALTNHVANLDLRLPQVALHIPKDANIQSFAPHSGTSNLTASVSLLKQLALIEEDVRTIMLSGILRALNVKAPPKSTVAEVILPTLDRICDLEDTFTCPFWRRCRRLYIPSETKFSDLLRILRWLPKGDYSLTIHIENLRLESSLAGEKARDFDTPEELQVVCHGVSLDAEFFKMAEPTINTLYEICLKLSSMQLISFLREECNAFISRKRETHLLYSSGQTEDLLKNCTLFSKFLDEALQEDLISGEDAILHLSTDVFKYVLMTAGTGHERYRRAFRITDTQPVAALPVNVYRGELTNMKRILSAIKTGKMKTVTVAILGSGINAFHTEFNLRLGRVRGVGRDPNCPFGDSIVGLSFNTIPSETTESFLDQNSRVGTVCAGMIAGKTKGAAPFANIISIKVSNSSNFSKPEFLNAGLSWLLNQERNAYLPKSDVVFMPMNFQQLSFETHQLLNHMSASGKIVVCSCTKSDGSFSPQGRPAPIGYPAALGDVICVGAHGHNGAVLQGNGQGRSVDLTALVDTDELSGVSKLASIPKISPVLAAAQAAGVVAYTLAYAEYAGGKNLRKAISNNSVMREILRQMCSKPAQHDEQSGFGCLMPHHVFQHNSNYFKQMVSEITSEYRESYNPGSRFRLQWSESLDTGDDTARTRSRSFTIPDELLPQRRRTRSHSENMD